MRTWGIDTYRLVLSGPKVIEPVLKHLLIELPCLRGNLSTEVSAGGVLVSNRPNYLRKILLIGKHFY